MHIFISSRKPSKKAESSAAIVTSANPIAVSTSSIISTLQPTRSHQTTPQSTRHLDTMDNTAMILEIVGTITDTLQMVPYVSIVASLLGQGLKMKKELDDCKEAWEIAWIDLLTITTLMKDMQTYQNPLMPFHKLVGDGFKEVEDCLQHVREAKTAYSDVKTVKKMLKRGLLKSQAVACVTKIIKIQQTFQMRLAFANFLTSQQPRHADTGFGKVLQCPPADRYFVGRALTLDRLSIIFSSIVVTVYDNSQEGLKRFVQRLHLKQHSTMFIDGSEAEAWARATIELELKKDTQASFPTVLVVENMSGLQGLQDLLNTFIIPAILVTSTNTAILSLASPNSSAFDLSHATDAEAATKMLRAIEGKLQPKQQVITIVAMGGTGKTQAVLRFISMNKFRFSNIWFFDASSDATLSADFKDLGTAVGVGEKIEDVKKYLTNNHQNWLCIFDNADDRGVEMASYIPRCNHGYVIITSRLTETEQMASPGCHIDLGHLSETEAIELLLKHADEKISMENKNTGLDIAQSLGCHALAVSTAGVYIKAFATHTLSGYLSLIKAKQSQMLNYKMKSLSGYQKTVYGAFQLSYQKLSFPTQRFMEMCAFLHHIAIPMEMFTHAANFDGNDTLPGEEPVAMIALIEFLALFPNNNSWEASVNELCQLSLATYNENTKALSFHSVIHACAQEVTCDHKLMGQTVMLLLGRAIPTTKGRQYQRVREQLLTHVSYVDWENAPTVHVQDCFANVFLSCRLGTQGGKLYKKVLSTRKEILGKHHPDTLQAMVNLAVTYCQMAKFQEAKRLEVKVLTIRKQTLGLHHPDTLEAAAYLATTYKKLGQLAKAERMEVEVLTIRKETLGQHHPDTLEALANLALTYGRIGKLREAERLQMEVLASHRETFGQNHSDTLEAMENLGATYYQIGKLEEARSLEMKVLTIRKETLGPHHYDTLKAMKDLALTYRRIGNLEEAEGLQIKVLTFHRATLGEYHPDTLKAMGSVAETYEKVGKLREAERLKIEVLTISKETLGHHHPATLYAMGSLASTYNRIGKSEEAQKLDMKVLTIRSQTLGQHHPDTLIAMANLAATYYETGNLEEAESLEMKVLTVCNKTLEQHHPGTLNAMANLAITYNRTGKLEEAQKLEMKVLTICKEALGQYHPDTLDAMSNLALTYNMLGKLEEAQSLKMEVFTNCKNSLGQNHPDTLKAMSNLAMTYEKIGKVAEAERLQTEVLNIRKTNLGQHHPDTLIAMANLSITYISKFRAV